jgi:hypothetical protein
MEPAKYEQLSVGLALCSISDECEVLEQTCADS